MGRTSFSERARMSNRSKPLFNENRWSATWLRSLLFQVIPSACLCWWQGVKIWPIITVLGWNPHWRSLKNCSIFCCVLLNSSLPVRSIYQFIYLVGKDMTKLTLLTNGVEVFLYKFLVFSCNMLEGLAWMVIFQIGEHTKLFYEYIWLMYYYLKN